MPDAGVAQEIPRRGKHEAGGDGLHRHGPGESKHADIGISLPGTGEAPAAPVFIDGEKRLTLRGDNIANEFHAIVEDYIEKRFGEAQAAPRRVTRFMAEKNGSARSERLTAVKGMNDILPPDSARWEWFEQQIRDTMAAFAYRSIRTPIVEYTPLFVKGTGETTDIVEKEMYSFEDRLNGELLTLRPENTPGVVRAAIEHNLTYDGPKRLYYMGPMFRHERPQRGRYRQFHQLGVEALGFAGPEADAEQMLVAHTLLKRVGVRSVRVELNSLGLSAERLAHRAALIAYFEKHAELLDGDAQRRLHANPLRILDTKNPAMQQMVADAPQLLSYLGEASLKHFDAVKGFLTACGVAWSVNPRLVRGLDYYSHTVFEFITDELGAQGTLCGGGRYDGLFELLGAKPTPAVGGAWAWNACWSC